MPLPCLAQMALTKLEWKQSSLVELPPGLRAAGFETSMWMLFFGGLTRTTSQDTAGHTSCTGEKAVAEGSEIGNL